MSRFAKFFAAKVFGVTVAATGLCSAALAAGAPANAEPVAPPVVPAVPALTMLQQFATNPAGMGAVLQTAATALNGASSIIGGPSASTLPVSPIQGAPAAPAGDPAAALPAGPGSALVPLLNQLGVPASLANLAPSQLPLPIQIGDTAGIAPAPPAVAVTGPLTAPPSGTAPLLPMAPSGTAPLLPVAPSGGQMPLLNALP